MKASGQLAGVVILSLLCSVGLSDDTAPTVDPSSAGCLKVAEYCLNPFRQHLQKGVSELSNLDDSEIAVMCRSYEVASKCVSYQLYSCEEAKNKYKNMLDEFQYACDHMTDKNEFWPFMVISNGSDTHQNVHSGSSQASDKLATAEEEWKMAAAKASIAAAITLVLISICVGCELRTMYDVRQKVKKAKLAADEEKNKKRKSQEDLAKKESEKQPLV